MIEPYSELIVPVDKHGTPVPVGTKVRLLSLSGQWLDDLPADEKIDVLSMIGEVFEIIEIDQFGHPWIEKSWHDETRGYYRAHSIALEAHEMEIAIESH